VKDQRRAAGEGAYRECEQLKTSVCQRMAGGTRPSKRIKVTRHARAHRPFALSSRRIEPFPLCAVGDAEHPPGARRTSMRCCVPTCRRSGRCVLSLASNGFPNPKNLAAVERGRERPRGATGRERMGSPALEMPQDPLSTL
jgi:hypothetical protein